MAVVERDRPNLAVVDFGVVRNSEGVVDRRGEIDVAIAVPRFSKTTNLHVGMSNHEVRLLVTVHVDQARRC